jgi:hypothetical protein
MAGVRRRAAACALLVALPLLALLWRFGPSSPPLYDGVCLAPAYRTVGQSPGPTSARQQFAAAPGPDDFQPSEVVTTEQVPQAQVLLEMGTLVSARPFTISVTPLLPAPQAPPAGWTLDGNVYRIVAVDSAGQQLQPQPGAVPATILLRATSSSPPKTMFRLDGNIWTSLKTFSAGCGDTFEAVSAKLGYFALFTQSSTPASPQGGGAPVLPIVIALSVVVVLTAGGLIYLNRPRPL